MAPPTLSKRAVYRSALWLHFYSQKFASKSSARSMFSSSTAPGASSGGPPHYTQMSSPPPGWFVPMPMPMPMPQQMPQNMPQNMMMHPQQFQQYQQPSEQMRGPVPMMLKQEKPVQVEVVQTPRWKRTFGSFLIIGGALYLLSMTMGSTFEDAKRNPLGMFNKPKEVATTPDVRFDDVKGCDESKAELEELVAYLKNPEQFSRLGGKMPRGVLLLGPPGTGKTLLAKAVAGEAGVPFFTASGSDFEEMFVGVGARRVRDLFAAAKKRAPAIIFIDEIDAVGSKRQRGDLQSTRASLNELLVQMDGFDENTGVVVIAATNFGQSLDLALTRPGRFDRHVSVNLPDVKGRKQILELYGSKVTLAPNVDLEVLARGTPGCSGAQLFNLINSAAIKASAEDKPAIDASDLDWAKDKILMGSERKTLTQTPRELLNTAFHEGGHALVALYTKGAYPIHKATILPRGMSLGVTHFLPEDDNVSRSVQQLMAQMDVAMGGRVAEELHLGKEHVTTGASNDFENATKLARAMVMHYGMNEKIGVMSVEDAKELSPGMRLLVDQEVQRLLNESYERAHTILTTHREKLERLATALAEHETLDHDEILAAVDGKALHSVKKSTPPKGGSFVIPAPHPPQPLRPLSVPTVATSS